MENASKALIIAGAILLAILLISLGILIYQQAAGVVNNNAMSELEVQNFNSKFTQYEGSKVRGTTVKALCQAVLQNNMSEDNEDRQIKITLDSTAIAETTMPSIKTGATYSVACGYSTSGPNAGLVNAITITQVTGTTNP